MIRIITVKGREFEVRTETDLGHTISEMSTDKNTYKIYHGQSFSNGKDTGVRIAYIKGTGNCIGRFFSDEEYLAEIDRLEKEEVA